MCGEESQGSQAETYLRGTPPRVWGRDFTVCRAIIGGGDTPTCVGKRAIAQCDHQTRRGHPHVCGEEFGGRFNALIFKGTPPRVWGRVTRRILGILSYRDTPTCVGKSNFSLSGLPRSEGHPHVCGEELSCACACVASSGTPPRVWGRDGDVGVGGKARRDTPTCVGKSTQGAEKTKAIKGHPHVCGEETKENDMQPILK